MVMRFALMKTFRALSIVMVICFATICLVRPAAGQTTWKVHQVYSGDHCNTAVAADYTGDGKTDVICNAGGITRLLVAPDWTPINLESRSCD